MLQSKIIPDKNKYSSVDYYRNFREFTDDLQLKPIQLTKVQ